MAVFAALLSILADDFHVSPAGDDARAGTSPEAAWRTLARVKAATLRPGDRVLLEGGKAHEGTLELDAADAGTAEKPITIGSYGAGRAVVRAGKETGLLARNCGGISVENIEFEGSSLDAKLDVAGIRFLNDLPGDVKLGPIRVSNVAVRGFRVAGIHLVGARGSSGYRDVLLEKVEASGNGIAGVLTAGPGETRGPGIHEDIRVVDGRFHDNEGFPGHRNHSGNGILVGRSRRVLIERCSAWNNGRRCDFTGGGPVGIWVWDCDRAVIQGCESYGNRTGDGSIDGGGFDFDGIVTRSVMQYNVSRDNDGAGFLVCPYSAECRSEGNVIRYNLSVNDGRAHGYSGIHVFAGGPVKNMEAYHNTIIMTAALKTPPRAVYVSNSKLVSGLRFRNNVFVTGKGVALVEVEGEPTAESVLFQGNAYWAGGAPLVLKWGARTVDSLDAWRTLGQESVEGRGVGLSVDPRLGSDQRPRADSPLLDAALDLRKLFGIDAEPRGPSPDIGAFERTKESWTSLFNGKDLAGWKADEEAAKHWRAKDGVLDYDGKNKDLWTEKSFGDFTLMLSWRWSGKTTLEDHPVFDAEGNEVKGPDGKVKTERMVDGGDSGVFLRGFRKAQANLFCYPCGSGEVWMYRTDPKMPADVRRACMPKKRADKPVGEWNRMKLTLRGDRLTVVVNDEEVISAARLPGIPERGPVGLQHEHGTVQFKDLFIKEEDAPKK